MVQRSGLLRYREGTEIRAAALQGGYRDQGCCATQGRAVHGRAVHGRAVHGRAGQCMAGHNNKVKVKAE